MIRSSLIWSGLVWFDLVCSGLVWFNLVWSGLVCFAAVSPHRKDVKIKTFKTLRLSSARGILTCDKYVVLEEGIKFRTEHIVSTSSVVVLFRKVASNLQKGIGS
jgi:hypothetical protein